MQIERPLRNLIYTFNSQSNSRIERLVFSGLVRDLAHLNKWDSQSLSVSCKIENACSEYREGYVFLDDEQALAMKLIKEHLKELPFPELTTDEKVERILAFFKACPETGMEIEAVEKAVKTWEDNDRLVPGMKVL